MHTTHVHLSKLVTYLIAALSAPSRGFGRAKEFALPRNAKCSVGEIPQESSLQYEGDVAKMSFFDDS